ncbi:MAG: TAT-variant-translocated molybdopterin oxidoreductase [Deltaproteobacteria bacterium]|nr:TAT-variant-translocated molybdopterin oxidoreductase [Deltaproteobacteria bacterium]
MVKNMEQTEKKYWGSIEELERLPAYTMSLGKEFVAPPEEQVVTEMERRSFLKVMGASLLLAGTACSRRPVEKIIPYVNQPEEIIPGTADHYASTCGECSASCGLLVKTREGRPIKLEGNDRHPMNRGRLCARGQASILNLYDPDRLKNPVKMPRGNGAFRNLSWAEADRQIKDHLAKTTRGVTKDSGAKIYLLTGTITSPSTRRLMADFMASVGSADASGVATHVEYEGVVPEEVALGQEAAYGQKVTPRFRFDQASVIVSFGADFLGTWLSPVEFSAGFAKGRQVEKGQMSRLVVFESALSLTGSNADEYSAVTPGDELSIALSLAHEIIVKRGQSKYAKRTDVIQALNGYDVASVAKETGISEDSLRHTANSLLKARGHGIVLGGAIKGANSLALQVAVNLLNSALENDGATIDYSVAPSNQAESSFASLKNLIDEMNGGTVGALFIYNTNPLYSLPPSLNFGEALKKVPMVVTIADRINETALESDFVCPPSHYLEAWSDASPQKGIFSIAQPVIAPLYDTRSFQDSLIQWGSLPFASGYDYLREWWQDNIYPMAPAGGPSSVNSVLFSEKLADSLKAHSDHLVGGPAAFEGFWEETLKKGVFLTEPRDGEPDRLVPPRDLLDTATAVLPRRESLSDARDAATARDAAAYGLALYPSVSMFDGRSANIAWLQELPDPLSKITWDNYVSMAPRTAKELKIEEGDVVALHGKNFDMELPVHLQPKMHPRALMAAIGYGRRNAGRVGDNIGVDLSSLQEITGGLPQWGVLPVDSIRKTGIRQRLATTQGHPTVEGRPIIRETTFAEYQKNPHAGNPERETLPSLWPKHEYKDYRWGMAIDMNACIGCNACMVACQSENNIPTVGKEQVLKGREMHWIRVDRYYGGEADQPEMNFQPMLCQHCENAPCETVCPVLATMHNEEGLNVQVYNRCVGTRYCSNNCPYKVRRFNFLDFRGAISSPLELSLNPDVTVRTRGVMEKCTFCIQRIRTAKDKAKDEGRKPPGGKVRDGEILTACQQTCPTNAIVFGDINDPESLVSKMKKSPRGYHVLEDLNVGPQVTYLAKVRNSG